ncbi:MAG: SGNH/GDSL hydrolase family protein [Hyphomicrobiales bacterium]|nr:SGNH/GDSL hydrolase family protein [Hyphomicrobiales bacterium]MBV9429077.1 SGNH/GDSL hydrolase family protein [Bradyrhizobiaceae bacterium]
MARLPLVCAGVGAVALAAILIGLHAPAHHAQAQAQLPAQTAAIPAQASAPVCSAPPQLTRFTHRLPRLADRVAQRASITIVAMGSSSTAGTGASSPAATYPARLEALLKERAVGAMPITVLNRGVGGEEIREMLARFDRDVMAAKPDLVLWQLGTNSVLHEHEISSNGGMLAGELALLKQTAADVVLINPQYAPKVLAHPAVNTMVELISATAKASSVELFDRFAIMKYWRENREMPFETFLSPDLLHMNDWGYDCVARLLANAITDAATRTPLTAGMPTLVGTRR